MRKPSRWIPVVGAAIVGGIIALVIAGTGGGHSHTTTTTTVVEQSAGSSEPTAFAKTSTGKSINEIYRRDSSGVVDIKVIAKSSGGGLNNLFGGSQETEGEGAGVVYDSKGDIITDQHVVKGAVKVEVTFEDGKTAPAKVLGSDPSTDVGVIKVNVPSSELHPIAFADSASARVGDPVVAIGSPFSLPETVTSGIVSYAGRSIKAPNQYSIPGSIQTDAPINPGNSGGPLLNASGQVLGLNDQIETDNTNSQTGEGSSSGIGFATPSNADIKVANAIIAGKAVSHAYIGASLNPTTGDAQIAQPSAGCATPVSPGSPAARAGLKPGDMITKLDGKPVTSTDQLIESLDSSYQPGQTVTLTVKRGGQTKQFQVRLAQRPTGNASCSG